MKPVYNQFEIHIPVGHQFSNESVDSPEGKLMRITHVSGRLSATHMTQQEMSQIILNVQTTAKPLNGPGTVAAFHYFTPAVLPEGTLMFGQSTNILAFEGMTVSVEKAGPGGIVDGQIGVQSEVLDIPQP